MAQGRGGLSLLVSLRNRWRVAGGCLCFCQPKDPWVFSLSLEILRCRMSDFFLGTQDATKQICKSTPNPGFSFSLFAREHQCYWLKIILNCRNSCSALFGGRPQGMYPSGGLKSVLTIFPLWSKSHSSSPGPLWWRETSDSLLQSSYCLWGSHLPQRGHFILVHYCWFSP
jgi:hypothetical protein